MSITNAFSVVQDAICSYNERWKMDYKAAMKCRDLEDWLYVGNGIFDAITSFDEKHQSRVFKGEIEFDPDHAELIKQAYSWWLGPCEELCAKIKLMHDQHFEVNNSAQFLSNCREAKGILTPDGEFFNHEDMVALRDMAIDEHRAGQSLEHRKR
jgi:hypothetical protein